MSSRVGAKDFSAFRVIALRHYLGNQKAHSLATITILLDNGIDRHISEVPLKTDSTKWLSV
jgi:hypothetical protein